MSADLYRLPSRESLAHQLTGIYPGLLVAIGFDSETGWRVYVGGPDVGPQNGCVLAWHELPANPYTKVIRSRYMSGLLLLDAKAYIGNEVR